MTLTYSLLSDKYNAKAITQENFSDVLELYKGNPVYFKHTCSSPCLEEVMDDFKGLPPGKNYDSKHFIGFFNQEKLVAVMDLIEKYPNDQTVWIGLFIMDKEYQSKGIGTDIIKSVTNHLRDIGYSCVQLGYVKENKQSESFWFKNGFSPFDKEVKKEKYIVIKMQLFLK